MTTRGTASASGRAWSADTPGRFEFKYPLDLGQLSLVHSFADTFCEPDGFGATGKYEVDSLYFDTSDDRLAQQTLQGIHTRFKVRLRTYGLGDARWFAEIKRRSGATILKERTATPDGWVEALLDGAPDTSDRAELVRFRTTVDRVDLRPRVWVRYQREAFVSPFGEGSRLTVDSAIEAQPVDPVEPLAADPDLWIPLPTRAPALLELKFNGAFPSWMARLVRMAELGRVSFSKYVLSTLTVGDTWTRGLPWTY
ncbi:MAG: polyphosphate polymerase domain-containing protein [Myxococcota bacterium]